MSVNHLWDVSLLLLFGCCCLVAVFWLFAIPWTAAHQASQSFTICQSLLRLMSIESVMQPSHLILCCALLLLIFPSIRVFSKELALHIRRSKYWSFSFRISPSSEYSELISFRIDWFDLSRVFSSTTIWNRQFFNTQYSLWSNSHFHTWLLENS